MARITNPAIEKKYADALPAMRDFQPFHGMIIDPIRAARLDFGRLVELGLIVLEVDNPNAQTYRFTDLGRETWKADNEYEPPSFGEFDVLYNQLVRCEVESQLRAYVAQMEALLTRHPELKENENIGHCLNNARGHCRGRLVPFRF